MDANILCDLIKARIDPKKFQIRGTEIYWWVEPTPEDLATVKDVTANYEALARAIAAGKMKQAAIDGIQAILDAQAKELGFDSIHTGAVWTISKNVARKARADALVAWGDAVWDFAEAEWEKQSEGKGTYSTVDEFLAALPKFPGVNP